MDNADEEEVGSKEVGSGTSNHRVGLTGRQWNLRRVEIQGIRHPWTGSRQNTRASRVQLQKSWVSHTKLEKLSIECEELIMDILRQETKCFDCIVRT